jgi:15-cis-phytoene synthase
MNVDASYDRCEDITRREAKNFAYGIRLLHPPERRALSAVYAMARRIDDIGDGEGAAAAKLTELARVRKEIDALSPDPSDAVLVALADATRRYGLPLAAFGDLIDGCEMDVAGTRYASFDGLVGYCRRVAGSIGRLSLAVFGASDPDWAAPLADDLGVALQLTNILRDVREDYLNGRVYLPAEDLAKFGCELTLGQPEPYQTEAQQARFASLVEFEAARAREWYASGMRLLATIDRRSAACTGAMAGIYRRLLERIASQPSAVLQGRMSLPAGEKALVAVQALTGVDRWLARSGGDNPPQTARSGAKP